MPAATFLLINHPFIGECEWERKEVKKERERMFVLENVYREK